jgi:hypothetical protein
VPTNVPTIIMRKTKGIGGARARPPWAGARAPLLVAAELIATYRPFSERKSYVQTLAKRNSYVRR